VFSCNVLRFFLQSVVIGFAYYVGDLGEPGGKLFLVIRLPRAVFNYLG